MTDASDGCLASDVSIKTETTTGTIENLQFPSSFLPFSTKVDQKALQLLNIHCSIEITVVIQISVEVRNV